MIVIAAHIERNGYTIETRFLKSLKRNYRVVATYTWCRDTVNAANFPLQAAALEKQVMRAHADLLAKSVCPDLLPLEVDDPEVHITVEVLEITAR